MGVHFRLGIGIEAYLTGDGTTVRFDGAVGQLKIVSRLWLLQAAIAVAVAVAVTDYTAAQGRGAQRKIKEPREFDLQINCQVCQHWCGACDVCVSWW